MGAALARARPARLLTRPQLLARRPAGVNGRGVLLSQGSAPAAVRWARRGIGAVTVAGLDGWTVVVPDGPAAARPPYDDAVRSLAGRPVPASLRPALGVFHVGRQIVLTVHLPAGVGTPPVEGEVAEGGLLARARGLLDRLAAWRPRSGWLIWTPREGLVAPDGLAEASVADVVLAAIPWRRARRRDALAADPVGAAGVPDDAAVAATTDALAAVLGDGTLDPSAVLAEVFGILSLPGHELFGGAGAPALAPADLPGAREVRPSPRATRAFERVVAEEKRHLDEMEL